MTVVAACSNDSSDSADGGIADSQYCRDLPTEVAKQYRTYFAAVRKDASPQSETEAIADLYTGLGKEFAEAPDDGIREAWTKYAVLGEEIVRTRRANPDPEASAAALAKIGGEVRAANDSLDKAIASACGSQVAERTKREAVAAGE